VVKLEFSTLFDFDQTDLKTVILYARAGRDHFRAEKPAVAAIFARLYDVLRFEYEWRRRRPARLRTAEVEFETAADVNDVDLTYLMGFCLAKRDDYARGDKPAIAGFFADLLVALDDERRRRIAVLRQIELSGREPDDEGAAWCEFEVAAGQ
jgi:hypothetical protein